MRYFYYILFSTLCLFAEEKSVSNLISNSPFLPFGYKEAQSKPTNKLGSDKKTEISSNLEFHGVFLENGKQQFSVWDKTNNKGYWVTTEPSAEIDFYVQSYNAKDKQISLYTKRGVKFLKLVKPTDKPMPVRTSPSYLGSRSSLQKSTLEDDDDDDLLPSRLPSRYPSRSNLQNPLPSTQQNSRTRTTPLLDSRSNRKKADNLLLKMLMQKASEEVAGQ